MKLNTTSQYAIRIMQKFAAQNQRQFRAKELSEELAIPYKYLTKVMKMLLDSDLLVSIRGREGGYIIAKNPAEIKVIDITQAVNECHDFDKCILGLGVCQEINTCALHEQWTAARKKIVSMLRGTTLKDIANSEDKKEALFKQEF